MRSSGSPFFGNSMSLTLKSKKPICPAIYEPSKSVSLSMEFDCLNVVDGSVGKHQLLANVSAQSHLHELLRGLIAFYFDHDRVPARLRPDR